MRNFTILYFLEKQNMFAYLVKQDTSNNNTILASAKQTFMQVLQKELFAISGTSTTLASNSAVACVQQDKHFYLPVIVKEHVA